MKLHPYILSALFLLSCQGKVDSENIKKAKAKGSQSPSTAVTEKPEFPENESEEKVENTFSADFPFYSLQLSFSEDTSLALAVVSDGGSPLLTLDEPDNQIMAHTGQGQSWGFLNESSSWSALFQPEYEEDKKPKFVYSTSQNQVWEVYENDISFHKIDESNTKSVSFEDALKPVDMSPLYVGKQGIIFFQENTITHIKEGAEKTLTFNWPPQEDEEQSPITVWPVSEEEYHVVTQAKLYRVMKFQDGDYDIWSWSKPVVLQMSGLSGTLNSLIFSLQQSEESIEVQNLRAITASGLSIGTLEKVEVENPDIDNKNPGENPQQPEAQLKWEGDIEIIAETYCYTCHKPGSNRGWKEALSIESWISKKTSILLQISGENPSMPDAPVEIDETSRARLIKWLEQQ